MPDQESHLPQVREIGRDEFSDLVSHIHERMGHLAELDYDALHDELRSADYLNIPIGLDPSLEELSLAARKVQAAKDRVSVILLDAERNFKVMKHYSKALTMAWIRLSGESSLDRRESDATTRAWDFASEAVTAEALYNAASLILENLKDKFDTISRNVTIIQLRMHLGEETPSRTMQGLSPDTVDRLLVDFEEKSRRKDFET